ncbi:1-phosphofructokinase [Marinitenerispora sediminis]|uniref:1-phosphofructokinase n=1 Tax=Marinitenerispora sediminis TaxID=1931232 RepID=A0A368T4P9_9ACTN|nr:1-phosphofructokinase [Marinitenerispora sediminis]RCV53174.1 1-phosphofructokinase [Marinitenerispora sediminis]RCV53715.1 1-phosphofructokinase [Marinitenerispora sediminis]RCV58038.1 1-phosphofructokinase [Marinitenerispora sediminis]
MIVTITPNPSVDRTLEISALTRGEVLRVLASHSQAGGKGVNVSRALRSHGSATTAVLPTGGADGDQLLALLREHDVNAVTVPVAATTRSNLTVAEADGTTTKLNLAGPSLSEAEVDALLAATDAALACQPSWLVASGSLPVGAPGDFYVRIAARASALGVPVALDTSGAPLEVAALAGSFALLKPNHEELAELLGRELPTIGDVIGGAREVLSWGNETVLVTLGGHGALLVDRQHSWWAGSPRVTPRSTVGAGDCTLAGYLYADSEAPERLRRAVAWGTAAVALPGTTVPGPDDIDESAVEVVAEPDPALVIKEL